jgi:hypothetical protein
MVALLAVPMPSLFHRRRQNPQPGFTVPEARAGPALPTVPRHKSIRGTGSPTCGETKGWPGTCRGDDRAAAVQVAYRSLAEQRRQVAEQQWQANQQRQQQWEFQQKLDSLPELHKAARGGDASRVPEPLVAGADVNWYKAFAQSPLSWALDQVEWALASVLRALLGFAVARLRRAPAADVRDVGAILRRVDRKYESTVKAIDELKVLGER